MDHVIVAAACLFGAGIAALFRVRTEFRTQGKVGLVTLCLMLVGFFGAAATAVHASYQQVWMLPLTAHTGKTVGALIALAGASLCLAARTQFTFRRAWGLDFDRLITGGIYRFSRNPQILGWSLMYVGVALFGRSGAGLLIASFFLLAVIPWVIAEERAMESRFGDAYRAYCKKTRRFL